MTRLEVMRQIEARYPGIGPNQKSRAFTAAALEANRQRYAEHGRRMKDVTQMAKAAPEFVAAYERILGEIYKAEGPEPVPNMTLRELLDNQRRLASRSQD